MQHLDSIIIFTIRRKRNVHCTHYNSRYLMCSHSHSRRMKRSLATLKKFNASDAERWTIFRGVVLHVCDKGDAFYIVFWWSSLLPSGSNAQSDNGIPHSFHGFHSIRSYPNTNAQHTHSHSMCAFQATSRHYVTGEWLKGIYLCCSGRIEATVYRLPNDISQYNEFQSNGTLRQTIFSTTSYSCSSSSSSYVLLTNRHKYVPFVPFNATQTQTQTYPALPFDVQQPASKYNKIEQKPSFDPYWKLRSDF